MPTPKYVQIKEYLKNEALKPEAVNNMPSVRTLMRRFNVAMVTVNQALLELEHADMTGLFLPKKGPARER